MASPNSRLQRSRLTIALLAAMAIPTGAALAQQTGTTGSQAATPTTEEATEEARKLDTVTVTGSRIKRAEVEGPAPLVVITREDIDREGYQTVGDMLQSLSQNTTANFTGDLATNGFTPNAQVVNLRNLGPGYTLTLVNGRRPAQYPQPYNRDNNVVNVKAIPSSMVERVEIMTGGASAIYGSDAVAGVVNIVTKTNFDGNFIRATVGTTEEGGGDSQKFEYTGGSRGDRWSAVYALQYGHDDPVFASQRENFASSAAGPRGGLPNVNPALSLIAIRASAHPSGPTGHNVFYPGQAACDAFGYTTVTTATRGHYCGSYDQPGSRTIFNENEFYSAYGYGTFDLTDNVQLFGSATYYASEGSSSSGTEFWGTAGDQFMRSSPATGQQQLATYYDPQFGSLIQLQRVFNPDELGGPEAATTLYDEKTYDLMVGANGVISDRFDWELTASTSRYEYTADRPRLLAKAVHDYFLGDLLGYVSGYPVYELDLDRWATPITPDIYQSFSTRAVNQGTTESSTVNFNITGDLWELPAGALSFAAVAEAGRQKTDLESDPRTNPLRPRDEGTIYNLTSSGETHGVRDRYAVGVEFRVPIFSTLTANVAGRYDKYDDITAVDDAITSQFGLEWRPLEALLVRASYATSFRAPDMQLVFAEGAASFSTIRDTYACRTGTGVGQPSPPNPRTIEECISPDLTVYQTQTTIAGNPLLKEEEGKSFSAGFVWDITDGMSMSVDYWRIRLEDAASQLSSSFILNNEANCRLGTTNDGDPFENSLDSAFCQNILGLITRLPPEPGSINDMKVIRINSAYINTALQDTSGIDATYKYNWEMGGLGRFSLDLAYSLQLTNRYKQFEEDELIDYRDDILQSEQRSRVKGSLTWMTQNWRTTLAGTRYGTNGNWASRDYTDPFTGGFAPRRLEPYMLYNLTVARQIGENLNVQLAVNNLFNNQYREDASNFGYPFFDYTIGADPLGRRFYLSAGYKF